MTGRCFVDSNLLVYAYDRGSGGKHERARDLLRHLWLEGNGVVSTQVLQEFYVNIRRKAKSPLPPGQAGRIVENYLSWEVVVNTGRSVLQAFQLEDRFQISFWDALIIQAANAAEARTLYTEDLNHNQVYGLVRVVNPLL